MGIAVHAILVLEILQVVGPSVSLCFSLGAIGLTPICCGASRRNLVHLLPLGHIVLLVLIVRRLLVVCGPLCWVMELTIHVVSGHGEGHLCRVVVGLFVLLFWLSHRLIT